MSTETMKLLGFIFSDRPTVTAQVENLITRATKGMFVLRHYSRFLPGGDLVKLYCGLVRSVLEYSSVTYHFMLTQCQSNDLENVQKKCLRCMFGYQKPYKQLLEESGLATLKSRRETAVLKFAQKTSENPVYSQWFRPNQNLTSQRNPKRYEEKFARTERLYKSPLYAMHRLLNKTPQTDPVLPELLDLSHLFNEP